MKKRKLFYLFPLAALMLSGCSFDEAMAALQSSWGNVTNFVSDKVIEPVKNLIPGQKDKDGEEAKPEKEEKEDTAPDSGEQGDEGEGGETTPQKQLTGIKVSGEFKNDYEVGEEFDPTGIVVTAEYDDGSSEDVTSQATFSGFSSEAEGPTTVTVSFEGQTAEIEFNIGKALTRVSFEELEKFFADNDVDVKLPKYAGESEDLETEFDDSYTAYYIKNSSHEEMDKYAEALEAAGWTLEMDDWDDYYATFGDTRATLYLADYINYSQKAIVLQAYMGRETMSSLSFAEIEELYEAEGIDVTIADYEGEKFSYEKSSSGTLFYIFDTTHEEMDAFAGAMSQAGWNLEKDSYEDYSGTFGETRARVYIADYLESMYEAVIVQFSIDPIPVSSISFEEMVEAYANAGVTVEIPDFEGAALNLDDSYFPTYYVEGATREEMDAFADAMKAAGWDLEQDSYEDYSGFFEDTGAFVEIQDYIDYGYGVRVAFSLEALPEDGFPSAEIAADATSAGVTDTIPEYTGANGGFSYYSGADGHQLTIFVADGSSEDAVIEAYRADLLGAGYTEAGEDKYGDMHYSSPNGEIDVCAWRGSDIGYDGRVYVDFEFTPGGGPQVPEGMTPEEAMEALTEWFDGTPEEISEGFYYLFGAYSAASTTPEDLADYAGDVMEYILDEFEVDMDWDFDDEGNCFATFINAANTVIMFDFYYDTVYIDDEGYIVDEGTEGATPVDATISEIYTYTDN